VDVKLTLLLMVAEVSRVLGGLGGTHLLLCTRWECLHIGNVVLL
jgi:hypothetical protein